MIAPEGFGEHGPFDVILELVGAPNLADNVAALDTGGRIAVIGIGAGAKAELNLGAADGQARPGSTARRCAPRPLEEKALTARAMERSVLPLLAAGAVTVPIAATYPLDQAAEAPTTASPPAASSARSSSRCPSDATAPGAPGRLLAFDEPGFLAGSPGTTSAAWIEHSAGPPDSSAAWSSSGVSLAPHSSQRSPTCSSVLLLEIHRRRV